MRRKEEERGTKLLVKGIERPSNWQSEPKDQGAVIVGGLKQKMVTECDCTAPAGVVRIHSYLTGQTPFCLLSLQSEVKSAVMWCSGWKRGRKKRRSWVRRLQAAAG